MIDRRALLATAALAPLAARAQSPWKGYYAAGTRQRPVHFAGGDGATLAGTLLLPMWSELQRVPGVVLIAGSGPTDRGGNNQQCGNLAEQGLNNDFEQDSLLLLAGMIQQ